jgi:hypothetical protein
MSEIFDYDSLNYSYASAMETNYLLHSRCVINHSIFILFVLIEWCQTHKTVINLIFTGRMS